MKRFRWPVSIGLVAAACVVSVASAAGPVWNVRDIPLERVSVVAHRGAGFLAPENTMEALELSWSMGCIPELDVRTTRDGHVMMFHDDNFARILPNASDAMKKKRLEDLTYDEAKQLDIGAFRGAKFAGQRIVSLAEIVSALKKDSKRSVCLDVKNVDFAAMAKETEGVHEQVVLTTGSEADLPRWKAVAPRSGTLLWVGTWNDKDDTNVEKRFSKLRQLRFANINHLQVHCHFNTATGAMVPSDDFIRRAGVELRQYGIEFQTMPWNVPEKPEAYARLLDLGTAGFGTDRPDVAMKALRDYYHKGPATAPTTQPVLAAADYGQRLAGHDGATLWSCDATRKVSRTRPAPAETGEAIKLSSARNEFEAAQLVIRPERPLRDVACSVTPLAGLGGAKLAASEIQLLRVGYVKVTSPTDKLGTVGEWPDPLPPITGPIQLAAGQNQPIWILVHVPADATPGDYTGEVRLSSADWSAAVPLRLHVWKFKLPERPFAQSAFGFAPGVMASYHRLEREADKRAVFDKYMRAFADHRISPYDPTPFDPIEIKFHPESDPPRAEVNFERFDRAMQRAIDEWHVTSFQLHIPGMGGGTFHSRHEGEIAGHKAGTPKYEAMFASAAGQIEAHLREKRWLDKAYVYWFDEPEPRDYAFVRAGMERLKKYAPGLRRMLTEEPQEPLFGAVDLWCPISNNFKQEPADARMLKGEQFWWYVCTGPKEPFCTLFIDHPATDLRAWLWQTWQRKIHGVLVWQSNYWTSPEAFPNVPQDPYDDPMSYVTSYGTPVGAKNHWGNGDGRFIYPPEAARPGHGDPKSPVLDGPVSSIRLEMLREGMEDYDYLMLIRIWGMAQSDPARARAAERLLEVPPEITRGATQYTFDSRSIYERRQQLGEFLNSNMGG
jgi:glycerophosphoryl diester phosphodiesterase